MKRSYLWLPVLLGSHALAYFAMHAHQRGEVIETAANREAGSPLPSKYGERRDEVGDSRMELLREVQKASMTRADFELARKELFRGWIKSDLGLAMDQLYGPANKKHFEGLADELQADLDEAIVLRSGEMWEWIRAGRFGSNREGAFKRWLSALGRGRQRAALFEMLAVAEGAEKGSIAAVLLHGADDQELVSLRKLLEATYESPDLWEGGAWEEISRRGFAGSDGDLPRALGQEKDPFLRQRMAGLWLEGRMTSLPVAERIRKSGELPEDVRSIALLESLSFSGRSGFEEFDLAVAEMNRNGLWQFLDREKMEELVMHVVGLGSSGYVPVDRVFGSLSGIDSGDLRHTALTDAGGYLAQNWESACEAIRGIPAGSDRDALIVGVTGAKMGDKTADIELLLGLISDPEIRREVEGKVAEIGKSAGEGQGGRGVAWPEPGIGGILWVLVVQKSSSPRMYRDTANRESGFSTRLIGPRELASPSASKQPGSLRNSFPYLPGQPLVPLGSPNPPLTIPRPVA